MNADGVREALLKRWPEAQYLHIHEAPLDVMRQGRKLDVVVVSLWQSRGLELDGVEIKVNQQDLRRELLTPDKADAWWHHVDRFWLAVSPPLVNFAQDNLPSAWGLLCASEAKTAVIVQAPKHKRKPFTWPEQVGLLRSVQGAGFAALGRAHSKGFAEGREAGQKQGARFDGAAELEQLRARVQAFEEASGIDISKQWQQPEAVGAIVKSTLRWLQNPDDAARLMKNATESVRNLCKLLDEHGDQLVQLFKGEAS